MYQLSEQEKIVLKRRNMLRGIRFRSYIALFLVVMEWILLLFNVFTAENTYHYNIFYFYLCALELVDLFVCRRCRRETEETAIQRFERWSTIYCILLLIWGAGINCLEVERGRGDVVFITVFLIACFGIHLFPKRQILLLTGGFLLNLFLLYLYHAQALDISKLMNYAALFLLMQYIGIQNYLTNVAAIRADARDQRKNEQLRETNRKLSELNLELYHRARTDSLTGIGNRLAATHRMKELWERKERFAISFIDLDKLKYCNDCFGHAEGDRYIKQACRFLQQQCGEKDAVYRLGGDEFLLIARDCTGEQLDERLECARIAFAAHKISEQEYSHNFSYGCVSMDPDGQTSYSNLLSLADHKMYEYKMRQRNTTKKPKNTADIQSCDRSGLESRVFEVLANSSRNRYLYLFNMSTNTSRWSKNAIEDFGLPSEYMYDAQNIWLECIHPDDRALYRADMEAILSGKQTQHRLEYRVKNQDGMYVMCSSEGAVVPGDGAQPSYFAGTITNHGVVDNIDPITSLYNVYELMECLKKLREDNQPFGLIAIEINKFSSINTSYGYVFGNRILQQYAEKLSEATRGSGTVFRLDGVKFAILLKDIVEPSQLHAIYNRASDIAQDEIELDSRHISVTISCGIVRMETDIPPEGMILSELMYALEKSESKQDDFVYYSDSMWESDRVRIERVEDIKQSVLNGCNGFYMLYQPQMNSSGKIIGVEALVRWKSEKWGTVPPGEFIPVLESDQCFYELGLWIIQQVLIETKPMLAVRPDLAVSVNISYLQLNHSSFHDDLLNCLRENAFPPENLVLELTEHCRTQDIEALKKEVLFFQSKGIRISADDFGMGYSSLSILRELPFNCIKIDRSFISHIVENPADQVLVQSIIDCAKQFDMNICVEGVETKEVFEHVNTYGPDFFQGYYFSKPVSIEHILEKLCKLTNVGKFSELH